MKYCGFCGGLLLHLPDEGWPRLCESCGRLSYNSPKPVIALAITTADGGILTIQRGIEPFKGEWALPGGYIDHREDWRVAAVREAKEEVGITLNPDDLTLVKIITTDNNFLVLCVMAKPLADDDTSWKEHDLSKTLNDTGEQEVVSVWVKRERPVLGIKSHQDFVNMIPFPE